MTDNSLEQARKLAEIDVPELIEAATFHIANHWRGFWSWEDIVEDLPQVILDAAAVVRARSELTRMESRDG